MRHSDREALVQNQVLNFALAQFLQMVIPFRFRNKTGVVIGLRRNSVTLTRERKTKLTFVRGRLARGRLLEQFRSIRGQVAALIVILRVVRGAF